MAKFKIDVDIDWADEYGTIDERLQESIKQSILEKIEDTVMDQIQETAVNEAEKRVGIWVNNYLTKVIKEKKFPRPVNTYDDKVEYITIPELINRKIEQSLTQEVDKYGKITHYNGDVYGTRMDWITGKLARKYADERVQEFVRGIKCDIEDYTSEKVKKELVKRLTSNLVQNIDFNKVFKEEDHESKK
ncbi:hypothetical protein [Clostridium tyrobutyricum]|uniref:hypothetical protein n=1 Tax=Clostridium tyrobutyricum TaxID=1519 RepID=UPI0002E58538|nr:hypothetical protein [Clostridium tyrobutyricum]